MKKILSTLTLVIAFAVTVVGCGTEADSGSMGASSSISKDLVK